MLWVATSAKRSKHRTRAITDEGREISISSNRRVFTFVSSVQDEVHRFAITFHRDKRSKRQTASELDNIPGIGPKTKDLLLKHFKSLKRIREASENELIELVGKNKGKLLSDYFKGFVV